MRPDVEARTGFHPSWTEQLQEPEHRSEGDLHDLRGRSARQVRMYRTWRKAHHGKHRFRSRAHAWRAVARMAIRQRRIDWYLEPYECRWSADWTQGKTAEPHIHLGHSSKRHSPSESAVYWTRRLCIWPVYRLRSRYRRLRKRRRLTKSARTPLSARGRSTP